MIISRSKMTFYCSFSVKHVCETLFQNKVRCLTLFWGEEDGKALQIHNQGCLTAKDASTPGQFLCCYSYTDKTVKSLSETKRRSSWHSSGSTVGRLCRFQALCTEGKDASQATWAPDPELEVSLPCGILSPSSIFCGIFLSQYEMFLWLCSV